MCDNKYQIPHILDFSFIDFRIIDRFYPANINKNKKL